MKRGAVTEAPSTWTLLIYTIPSQPTRLRAAIWRELKKLGAVYLRDGVCVLPAGEATSGALAAVAARVDV
jgi:DNA-binding transcriptional regulator PaaX